MGIGSSITLIAIGAILKWAVTTTVSGISLQTVGVILMVAGVLGLLLSLLYNSLWSGRHRADVVAEPYPRERVIERDRVV
ncbi:MAG TPA: DUF6458 family protein [Solirubrobacteraceae bacterium]|jgi:uncharacterized protein (DUF58 family)|nr:DUF6458 family protein [Solirubrobacteraceae bacterium]